MKQWYYTVAGEQIGPVAENELKRLFQTGEFPPDTLVWSEGLEAWSPARQIEGLVPATLNPLPPAPPRPLLSATDPNGAASALTPSGAQVRPWIRYWARMMDFFIFCFFAGIPLALVYPPIFEIPDALLGILFLFIYNFVEPAMFATWGTTPGKAMLRVRVRNSDGGKLSYSEALDRVFKVWLRGEGLGIPIVVLFTQINAYSKLTSQGKTSWDEDGNFTVSHEQLEAWRVAVVVLFFIGFIFLMALGQADL